MTLFSKHPFKGLKVEKCRNRGLKGEMCSHQKHAKNLRTKNKQTAFENFTHSAQNV